MSEYLRKKAIDSRGGVVRKYDAELLERSREEGYENLGLEGYIAEVDYSRYEDRYEPSEFSLKFINFIKLVNGGRGEENKSPLFHYEILDTVSRYDNSLIVSFRGSAKSSICAEYMFLYIAVFGGIEVCMGKQKEWKDVQVAMYIGDTMENGCKNLRSNIEYRYNASEFLQKYVPKVRFTDIEMEFENLEGHKLCVRNFGISTGVRGFKKYGMRPTFAVMDDLMTDKNAESVTVVRDIENVIYKAVRQAMHPTQRKIVWIGTPFNKKDPLYKAAGSVGWTTRVYPICEKFPCKASEFRGAWEDRFSYETIKREYSLLRSNGRIDAFNQELMLRIMSEDDRLVLDGDLMWYEDRGGVIKRLSEYNVYITTDFATSEKQGSDFSVIAVWALDYEGNFHWVDGICRRQTMDKNVDDIFRLVDRYHPLSVGVEISGQQRGFVNWIKRDMNSRGVYFGLATDKNSGEDGLRPNTSKLVRFNVALPLIKAKRIWFPKEMRESEIMSEYVDELTSITPTGIKSLHDDCVDTISQLPLMDYVKPYDPRLMEKEKKTYLKPSRYFGGINDDNQEINQINSYIV